MIIQFLLIAALASAQTNSFLTSSAASILNKYPDGLSALNSIRPGGRFASVSIQLLSETEIKVHAGHNGGGLEQDKDSGAYTIILNKDLPADQIAQAFAHEFQHLKDENDFDAFLKGHPDLNAIGPSVIAGLRSANPSTFIQKNKAKVDFMAKGLFCQELRAYGVNIKLNQQGLKFQNDGIFQNAPRYIADQYVKAIGVNFTNIEMNETAEACRGFSRFSDFMNSLAPGNDSASATRAKSIK